MTLQERLSAFISAVGADIKTLFTRSIPAGGTTGQVLTKSSNSDYAASWQGIVVSQISDFSNGVLGVVRTAKVTLTDSVTVTWNVGANRKAQVTLAGNRTLSITNAVDGEQGVIIVVQDGTGNRTLNAPANSRMIGTGPITVFPLSTAANSRDILSFWLDGTTYYWNIGRGY